MRIDFHSHILPGIDDGSKSVEQSIEMLKQAAEQGIGHMVATPHFYPRHDTPERFLKRRERAEQKLREEMAKYSDLPQISMGAEVYFFRGISEFDALSDLTIANGRYLLLEMPMAPWSDSMYREMEQLYMRQGITPVIAHIDRYISPFRTHGIPKKLSQLPVLVQANAEFFQKFSTQAMAMQMLRKGQIHLLGSDCHNLSDRKPNLGPVLDWIEARLGTEAVSKISQCGETVLSDAPILFCSGGWG